MEGRTCRELIWSHEVLQVLWRGESPDHGEKIKRQYRGREREHAPMWGTAQENYAPKALTEKKERV